LIVGSTVLRPPPGGHDDHAEEDPLVARELREEEQGDGDGEEHHERCDVERWPPPAQVECAGLGLGNRALPIADQQADGLQYVDEEEQQRRDADDVVERLLVDEGREQQRGRQAAESDHRVRRGLRLR
jgi:hypothetical protein